MLKEKIISLLHNLRLFSLEKYYASQVGYEFTPLFFSKDEIIGNQQLINTIMNTEKYFYKTVDKKDFTPGVDF
jgi:hypothetical protein